ncbi:hypothetical protein [Spirochaeta isovalerica]|uniref:Uncharacterized protein n=1 Tax=Spirochaeta isovalerica TaxID=150 RepID=A0A841RAM3_9SPIO|nr:hypothetical protein [Spirochaeta isovalerica]MBB6482434.1 hypothetical protein [Spirochaeta isovalerica]
MNIETADGKTSENVGSTELKEILASLDSQVDFAILSHDENYLQCAFSTEGYYMEYQDGTGHYEWTSGHAPYEKMEETFIHYLENNGEIPDLSLWKKVSGRVNHSGQSGFSGSLIDQLKAEAKQGLKRAINRKTSGLVRNTLKKLIK